MTMKCLVTGAAGFIGSALTQRLSKDGHDVTALLHTTSSQLSFHKSVNILYADITNPEILDCLDPSYDVVFHCAAYVKDYGSKKKFTTVNVKGTQNIINHCDTVKRFIYLSHIRYENPHKFSYYMQSKYQAEQYLLQKHQMEKFPVVIIRPGNVYGPGATTWVCRPLEAIQHNKIALINHGTGIFHHTYIDNLIDALILTMNKPNVIGKAYNITDNDDSITWKQYFNDLAAIANKPSITQNISKPTAVFLSYLMIGCYKITGRKPLLTPSALQILTNTSTISIEPAKNDLEYTSTVSYLEGMKQVKQWLETNHLIEK